MTININYDGKSYRTIKKEDAYILSISISHTNNKAVLDLDQVNFDEGFIRYTENLPNNMSVELVIARADKEIIERYSGLETMHAVFDKVTISATL